MRYALLISWLCFSLCAQAAKQPDIVFFLIDDLGFADCGFNGGKEIKTPNIDRLAQSGAIIDSHYVQPVCSPTRFALMTGRYQQRCAWVPDAELTPLFRKQRAENLKQRWAWPAPTTLQCSRSRCARTWPSWS